MSPPSPAPFQVASLVNSPSYPNSVVWSDDNLIAVATGDIVTILSPENPQSPRGVITLTPGKPFPVGVIDRSDLLAGCLLPIILSRDRQPCVRSISWSPAGFTPNNGCLLAVCSTEGHVKLFREPHCEFQTEWIEEIDISDMLHGYFMKVNYEESVPSSLVDSDSQIIAEGDANKSKFTSAIERERKRKRVDDVSVRESPPTSMITITNTTCLLDSDGFSAVAETAVFTSSLIQGGSLVEVFDMDGREHVWRVGRLQSLEGLMGLVQFSDTDGNGEQCWVEMDSLSYMSNQPNDPGGYTTDKDHSFPSIRPCMDVARLPEEILFLKHVVGEILKVGQVIEAWTKDRWLGGIFKGFTDGGILVSFDGNDATVLLNPSDVRIQPLWTPEDKLWKVTIIKVVASRNNQANAKLSPAKAKRKSTNRTMINPNGCLLTPHQHASRSSMLASLVIAWSPKLQLSSNAPDNTCVSCCLLAVGTKSGTISIWKLHRPLLYTIEYLDDPINVNLVEIIHAHSAWVTALSWGFLASDSSPQIVLASGCSDGSAKIWMAHVYDFKRSSEVNQSSFSLFCEVTASDKASVSVLSLCVPVHSAQKILLAVGRGSGSIEVWMCSRQTKNSKKVGSCDAHVQAVTGLAWAFDGCCLYGCSQDNSIHGWKLQKGSFSEVSVPPNNLGIRNSSDLPSVSDSSYGVAVSPGNLALAVARRFDAGQLDHMYQKRTQRAAVEFFWIGGQEVNILSHISLEPDIEACPGFSKEELRNWGLQLLWSLKQYECHSKHVVVWDVLAAALAFKQAVPKFIKYIVLRWLELLLNKYLDQSTQDIFSELPKHMPKMSSRQLHLFNIVCRRVLVYSSLKVIKVAAKPQKLKELCGKDEEEKWVDLMSESEKELRQRLVGLSLSAALVRVSDPALKIESHLWSPVGVAQMVKWVAQNQDHVPHQLYFLATNIRQLNTRPHSVCEFMAEENCCYCSAVVPFESPEMAFCEGVQCKDGEAAQKHKIARCSVSMQVCPLTPLWFCMCCQRRASKLPPGELFTLHECPPDFMPFVKPIVSNLLPTPLCPYCGISLQRRQPDFLLSKSPV